MKLIELHWSFTKGEGSVKYTKTFDEVDKIVQLDMLQDCIVDLENKYAAVLAQPYGSKTNE